MTWLAKSKNLEIDVAKELIKYLQIGPNGLLFSKESLAMLQNNLETVKNTERLCLILSEFIVFAGFLYKKQQAVLAASQLLDLVEEFAVQFAFKYKKDIKVIKKIEHIHEITQRQRKTLQIKDATIAALKPITQYGIIRRKDKK